ncbi:unnamed protein product [Somion occarium]|uniref:DRBM domain-containing protein n=1 Tax=Somion occarium TaxID=3059160 RepID=A0ABP1CHW7_9APHY
MVLPMAFINSKHTFEHSLQYPQAQSVFYITLIFVFTMTDHWRRQLNNLLQRSYGVQALQWVQQQHGSQHQGLWEARALIQQIEYGRGMGQTCNEAKEEAAYRAYTALSRHLGI